MGVIEDADELVPLADTLMTPFDGVLMTPLPLKLVELAEELSGNEFVDEDSLAGA